MQSSKTLKRHFARAGIELEITRQAFLRGVSSRWAMPVQITQIDIRERPDRIVCFPGQGSQLQVLGVDSRQQQVVLSVTEPERQFTEQVWDWRQRRRNVVSRQTQAEERRLLIGMDERHLFVAQLDEARATTVRNAHQQLAPQGIPGSAKARKKLKIKRQGEWFFVPLSDQDAKVVAAQRLLVERGLPLGSTGSGARRGRGRPHLAQERVRLLRGEGLLGEFARGWIRHPEHKTLVLKAWHRVLSNTEDRSVGATWVD